MLKSMTGYSKAELNENGYSISTEIKSLNGRYLETHCRLPKTLFHKEIAIKEIIRKSLSRGSVNISVAVENSADAAVIEFNENAAKSVFSELQKMRQSLNIRETVKIDHMLHFAGEVFAKDENEDADALWSLVEKTIREALNSLNEMRKKEGQRIGRDLNDRMKNIQKTVLEIESKAVDKIPEEREKLRRRIAMLFESDEIDEQRLQTEMVILADKLDVSEECVRMKSHMKFFFETIKSREAVGRKINFLLQEMNREINTIGSKINDADISQQVVHIKDELERIREQTQNVE